jgi:hypothetical protein
MALIVTNPPCEVVSTWWISIASGPATSCGQAANRRRATSFASSTEPMKPAMAVTTMTNGNTDMRIDKAIWLAIAQPSSRLKR